MAWDCLRYPSWTLYDYLVNWPILSRYATDLFVGHLLHKLPEGNRWKLNIA